MVPSGRTTGWEVRELAPQQAAPPGLRAVLGGHVHVVMFVHGDRHGIGARPRPGTDQATDVLWRVGEPEAQPEASIVLHVESWVVVAPPGDVQRAAPRHRHRDSGRRVGEGDTRRPVVDGADVVGVRADHVRLFAANLDGAVLLPDAGRL